MTTNTTLTLCPSCQGAGAVLGTSGRAGMGPQSFRCRTCWSAGHVPADFAAAHPHAELADRMRAEGREPSIKAAGGPFGHPRSFAGWVRRSHEVAGGWFVRPDAHGKFESGRHGEVEGDDHSWADGFAGIALAIEAEGECPRCAIEHDIAGQHLVTDLDDRPLCPECGWAPGETVTHP